MLSDTIKDVSPTGNRVVLSQFWQLSGGFLFVLFVNKTSPMWEWMQILHEIHVRLYNCSEDTELLQKHLNMQVLSCHDFDEKCLMISIKVELL